MQHQMHSAAQHITAQHKNQEKENSEETSKYRKHLLPVFAGVVVLLVLARLPLGDVGAAFPISSSSMSTFFFEGGGGGGGAPFFLRAILSEKANRRRRINPRFPLLSNRSQPKLRSNKQTFDNSLARFFVSYVFDSLSQRMSSKVNCLSLRKVSR